MKWEPWYIYKDEQPQILDIPEPPCRFCKHWKPMMKFSKTGENIGIKCCVAEKMYDDFSCYQEREDENENIEINLTDHQDRWTPASHGLPCLDAHVIVILHDGNSFKGTVAKYENDYVLNVGSHGYFDRNLIAFWKHV